MRPVTYRVEHVPTCFVDLRSGRGVRDDGRDLETVYAPDRGKGRLTAETVIGTAEANGCRRVFLTGAKPTSADWLDEPAPGYTPAGHFYELRDPCGRWRRDGMTGGGWQVEVRRVASWFGEGDYTPGMARDAMAGVHLLVKRRSNDAVHVMASPAATGQALWATSLGSSRELLDEQLDDETANLIRATTPQHREEVVGVCFDGCDAHLPQASGRVRDVRYLDAVFMYAACVRELGVAPVERIDGERYVSTFWQQYPYRRARYRVRFTVPTDWDRAGVLPVKHDNGRNWHYPNRPGWSGEAWADGCELAVAERFGWDLRPVEVLAFTEGRRPLDKFTDWVRRMREVADADRSLPYMPLVSAGLRSMFVRTIGSFHSRGRERSYVVKQGELPGHVAQWEPLSDGRIRYTDQVQLTGAAAAFARPELSAQVWARARARVLARMMTVAPADLVAVWGDALYLAGDYGDRGERPGEFRVKRGIAGPVARPKTIGELLRLKDRMVTQ